MILFNASDVADYKAELPRRVEGTCSWILTHPQYMSWVSTQETTLLWITGHPGCGKTILSAYLIDYLNTGQTLQSNTLVCCFFCDDKIATQRDGKAILRSIIYQMLRRHRRFIRHVKAAFEIQGSQLVHSFEALWNIFTAITNEHKSGPINIIVDAIDECEEKTRIRFLDAVTNLVQRANLTDGSLHNSIKLLITSRPYLNISYNFNDLWNNRLPIEESQETISGDVRLVIERRVDEIVKRSGCTPRVREYLEQTLYSRADHTFLWVKVVLRYLEQSLLASEKDFQKIPSSLPPDLESLYESFLSRIPSCNQNLAVKILHILVGSSRYLTLQEFGIVLAVDNSHRTVAEVEADCQPSISRTIQGILGPLVRISESKVSLVHQSAKEFLVKLGTRSENPLSSIYGVDQGKASLILASSCVSYLLLQDFADDHFLVEYSSSENSSAASPILGMFAVPNEEMPYDPIALEQDVIFKDEDVVEAEACRSIINRYSFFDYAATHWAKHFSLCDDMAPQHLQDAAVRLTTKNTYHLFNWLRYFWFKMGIEFWFPEDFDSLTVTCFFNHPTLLERLLARDSLDDQRGKDYALFWAARMGSEKTTEILLRIGAEPNSTIVDRRTPLNIAAQQGHYDIVKALIADQRTDVNLKGKLGRSPLSLAAGNGHLDVVELLLKHEQTRHDEKDDNQWTPLFWAIGGNHLDVVRALLKSGSVNINHTDKTGRSAFSWAAGDGFTELVRYLLKSHELKHSLKYNLPDRKGRTALSWAAENGHAETVRVLARSKHIDLLCKDVDGRNAISWACSGGHAEALKTLIKYGCTGINDEDVSGWTPLAWALTNWSLATVETLVSTGSVDIDKKDQNGRTALSWAAGYGYLDVVQFLLSEGADVRTVNNGGWTPMSFAKAYNYTDVIQELEAWMATPV